MKRLSILLLAMAFLFSMATAASALDIGGLTFTALTGDLTLDSGSGTGTAADPIVLNETVTGLDVTMSIRGLPAIGDPSGGPFVAGFYMQKFATNNTGADWNFYDLELQQILGTPSTEGDGLSFAQGWTVPRPWTSDKFADVDEVTDVRDFINFSNGIVAPGETVSFSYVITDNTPNDLFYLRQRPNFSVAPEPGTLLLITTGLLGLVGFRRKFRS